MLELVSIFPALMGSVRDILDLSKEKSAMAAFPYITKKKKKSCVVEEEFPSLSVQKIVSAKQEARGLSLTESQKTVQTLSGF